ncbi:MAG: hypothetical protein PHU27_09910, partial [Salinivirgaceae bacterium]|nr:hypothetical protein [Salinivirgaceae bacterium]
FRIRVQLNVFNKQKILGNKGFGGHKKDFCIVTINIQWSSNIVNLSEFCKNGSDILWSFVRKNQTSNRVQLKKGIKRKSPRMHE